MSSAALHAASYQQNLASPPPLGPSSNRPYSSHSSPTAEVNNALNSNTAAASPSSRRPPSRKKSGNGNGNGNGHYNLSDPNAAVTSRSNMPHHSHYTSPPADRSSGPPVAPPRTSSNQQGGTSRRAHASSERVAQHSSRSGARADTNGASENGHRHQRGADSHFAQDLTGRPNENRDNRGATTVMPIRTQNASNTKPSRDANENLVKAVAQAEDPHARTRQAPSAHEDAAATPPNVNTSPANDERRAARSRHDYSNRTHKGNAKFGDFILGNTIGEGEFGKVKLGWKQDSSEQVAIKLIKRDTVGSNPSRMAKIRREVTILKQLHHPNIVRLTDMVETDRYIGIILEYASGGELFDYILNHRYLKDQSARRLFAQLVSGVGYLHKKGIVHRDLKLENLLLDRNRNIIITDFGFANTFDPDEELGTEEESNLTDREYVKRTGLDKVKPSGMRKGDLMQTSCGSPCYAAPELVVSDCLYTGRKVDVWSCGVILYAMLAGYLPFDDDPANPEGDNINLLYKYIVSTPLTFPEYVTPHARDLLRRILVPNPRKRADLFEVARHSWLSDYSHVVEFITSSTTLPKDVQKTIAHPEEYADVPLVQRSNSVRDAQKQKTHSPTSVGGLAKTHGKIDGEAEPAQRTPKDAKRRTVQVEYVAPTTQTQRGADAHASQSRTRSASRGRGESQHAPKDKPLPKDPPVSQDGASRPSSSRRPQSSQRNAGPHSSRQQRPVTENAYLPTSASAPRPQTGGSLSSAASMGLQSMGHYGQPAPPAVADTNVEGRMAQPVNPEDEMQGRPSISVPSKFARVSGMSQDQGQGPAGRGHKRSSTLGELGNKLMGRNGSVFGRSKKRTEQQPDKSRKYPPVSMQHPIAANEEPGSRPSMDSRTSRRSFSLGLSKKRSGSESPSQGSGEKSDRRRFSFLPPSVSKSVGLSREPSTPPSDYGSQSNLPMRGPEVPRSFTSHGDARGSSPVFEPSYSSRPQANTSNPARHQRYASAQLDNRRPSAVPPYMQSGAQLSAGSDSSVDMRRPPTEPQMSSQRQSHQHSYSGSQGQIGQDMDIAGSHRMVLQKGAKKFTDHYDQEDYRGHEGSSGAAKRVMDFFRRRGKARGGDER